MPVKIENYDNYIDLKNKSKMSGDIVSREYTVYQDESGRDYFLSPQTDNTVKRVYLDSQFPGLGKEQTPAGSTRATPQPQHERLSPSPDPPHEVHQQPLDGHTVDYNEEPPASRGNRLDPVEEEDDAPPNVVYLNNGYDRETDAEPGPPLVRYIRDTPENEPYKEEVSDRRSPEEKSPEVIYTRGSPERDPYDAHVSEWQPTPDETNYIYMRASPLESPRLRRYQHQQDSNNKKSTSPTRNESPQRRKKETKQDKPKKYQPKPKPGQSTAMVGGVLIVDNDPWKPSSKVDHKNDNYIRSGGNVEIMEDKLQWDKRSKVSTWNDNYQRSGGNVVILHENLPWRKNAKRILKQPAQQQLQDESPRAYSSENQREPETSQSDTRSEGAQSWSTEPERDYVLGRPNKNTYANRHKSKLRRYVARPQNLPPIDLKDRKPLKAEDITEVYQRGGSPDLEKPKRKLKLSDDVPEGFKPSPRNQQKLESRPPFRLTAKKEFIPSLHKPLDEQEPKPKPSRQAPVTLNNKKPVPKIQKISSKTLDHVANQKPSPQTSSSWKEPKIEKITSKTLDKLSSKKKAPTASYADDNYGGYHYDEEVSPDYLYDDLAGTSQQYNQARNNNRFNSIGNQGNVNSRKRNQPVY